MKHKLILALVVSFVFGACAKEWDDIPQDDFYSSLGDVRLSRQAAWNKFIRDHKLLSWADFSNQQLSDEDNNDITVESKIITTEDSGDQLITGAEIQFDTSELNILRDNEDSNTADTVHKKEDQKVGQEQQAKTVEAEDDDDGEKDEEEDIEEEEERYDDDTDMIKRKMVETENDIYLQSFMIFVSGFVLGGAISFFFMTIKNRYRDLKEPQLVLES